MTEPTTFLRLDATPPQKSPPPADAVDVFYDPEAASLKVQKPDGTTEEIGGGGASAWDGLTGTASKVPFDTTSSGPTALGELAWDSTNETLSLALKGDAVLQIGQETYYRVVNSTGSTITDGSPVMYAGTNGNSGSLKIKLWDGTDATKFMGLATQDIPDDGSTGFVTHFGVVRGIRTNGGNYSETWADEDTIYTKVGSAGLTHTQPTTGDYAIVGRVISAHGTNGTLFVRPQLAKVVTNSAVNTAISGDVDATAEVLSVASVVNAQQYSFAKISAWDFGGTGTAAPLRLMWVGDSLTAAMRAAPNMARAGVIGLGRLNSSGTITALTNRYDYWINGTATEFAVSSQADYTVGSSATGDIRGTKAAVAYIKRSGGGSFDLQYQSNATGSWTTLATIDTSNASTIGAWAEYSLPLSVSSNTNPVYRLRIANVTTGSVVIIATGIYYDNGGGVIECNVATTGLALSDAVTTPSAVLSPIWAGIAPDCVVSCWDDSAASWEPGGNFRTFYAATQTAKAATDWILVSAPPSSTDYAADQYTTQRDWAISAGQTWINGYDLFHSYTVANARGLYADTVHPNTAGYALRDAHIWSSVPLGYARLGAVGRTYNSSEATWQHVGQTVGANDPVETPFRVNIRNQGGLMLFDASNLQNEQYAFQFKGQTNQCEMVTGGVRAGIFRGGNWRGYFPYSDNYNYVGSPLQRFKAHFSGLCTEIVTKTANYTATEADHTILVDCTSGAITITLPAVVSNLSGPNGNENRSLGRILVIKKIDSSGNAVTIDANASELIDGATTQSLAAQWNYMILQCNGTAWYRIG